MMPSTHETGMTISPFMAWACLRNRRLRGVAALGKPDPDVLPDHGRFNFSVLAGSLQIRYGAPMKWIPLFFIALTLALPSCDRSEARNHAEERLRQATRSRVEAKHRAGSPNATVADGVEYTRACAVADAAEAEAKRVGIKDPESIALEEFQNLDRELTKQEADKAAAIRAATEQWREQESQIRAFYKQASPPVSDQ